MVFNYRALARLLPAVLLLGASPWLRPLVASLEGQERLLIGYLPYALAGLCAVVSLLFNRVRPLALCLLLGYAYWVIQVHLQVSLDEPAAAVHYLSLCVSMAATLAAILLVPERGVRNRFGILTLVGCAAVFLLSGRLAPVLGTLWPGLSGALAAWPAENFVMSVLAAVLFAVVGLLGLFQLLRQGTHAEAAALGTLVATFLALARFDLAAISTTQFALAGLLQLLALLRSSHDMAYRDELTGLPGRRALDERLKGLPGRCVLAMVDVDRFKKFNDTHGHHVGDEVLKLVASRLAQVGAGGRAYRYGGEEFCIVFPRRDAADCEEALEALRLEIAGYEMALRDRGQRPQRKREGAKRRGRMATRRSPRTVSVTVSIGAAHREDGRLSAEETVKQADSNLYRAKRAGRNRLVMS